jgi:hypothetical protein
MSLNGTKLSRVLAMISSNFDDEALTAARRARELVKAAGLTWEQVLDNHDIEIATEACRRLIAENNELREQLARLKAEAAHEPGAWFEPYTTTEKIDRCVEYAEYLTGWERGFVTNIAGWRGPLT